MPKPHPVYPRVITEEVPPGLFVAIERVVKPVHGERRGLDLDFLADDGRSGQGRLRVVGPMKEPDVPGTDVLDEDSWDIAGQCLVVNARPLRGEVMGPTADDEHGGVHSAPPFGVLDPYGRTIIPRRHTRDRGVRRRAPCLRCSGRLAHHCDLAAFDLVPKLSSLAVLSVVDEPIDD